MKVSEAALTKKSSLYLTLKVAQIRNEKISYHVVCTVHTALKSICACSLKVAWKKIGLQQSFLHVPQCGDDQ